ncbi:uncharacterized protein LOC128994268 [Macrosteles quadrilineatus]|uniref:uncharacterized protein LOC128994268 n=1 Tax=Macrosteles quadrilineatus TaxID=74068 RepID=UPI0023E243A0|nr:uncharacterized protein LOC128994268 [Macrosteles quadrilineatus]XP_054274658.1 uncharacterized protein LOC128994268 [Macrosteles quadrilineatus]
MSVIIRLQNLPWSANALDIRQYFQGLSIPEGGVHIVGGELGDAFIAFSTDEDARQAMLTDGGKIKEVKIKLYLSSRSEMQKVIETARAQSMSLQTFMQMPSTQIPVIPATQIPPTPSQTTPVIPPMPQINQIVSKPATPEIKPPPVPVSSIPTPEVAKPEPETEKKDQDTDSISGKDDKRGRKGRSRSKSKNRSKSKDRSRSRDRSKSRDRSRDRSRSRDRNHRRKDNYRDRRRRNRSRSRDRRDRRRYRDRSRSRDRSRRSSKDKKRDYDRNEQNNIENSNDAPANVAVEKDIPMPTTLAQPGKPGFSNSGWVAAGASDKATGPLLSTPIGFSISKNPTAAASQPSRSGTNPNAQQIQIPNQIPVPQQAIPMSQPLNMPPQPPNFPMMPMDVPKDQDGRRFDPNTFPPGASQLPHSLPPSLQNTPFGRNQPLLPPNESNSMMPLNDLGKFPNMAGWPPMRPPMDPSMMMPMPEIGNLNPLDKQPLPQPMGNMGMFMRPPMMVPNDKFQPPYVKHDPRMQSDFTQSQIRNDGPYPPQQNFPGSEFGPSNTMNVFINTCVEIRDMSMNTTSLDIRRFFQGLLIPENGIKIITDKKGNKVGIAYVRFGKVYFKDMALKKTGQLLNGSPVEVLHIDDNIFDKATDVSEFSENYLEDAPAYPKHYNDSFRRPQEPMEHFTDLVIHDVPSFAKDRDIYSLFKGLKVADAFVLLGTGRKTATGYVRFESPAEARKALTSSSRLAIGYTSVKAAVCYEHEFDEARDRKNMEENDEEIMDPKDTGYIPQDARGSRFSKNYPPQGYGSERTDPRFNQSEKRVLLPTPGLKPFDPRSGRSNSSNPPHFDKRQNEFPSRSPREDFHQKPYGPDDMHHQKTYPRDGGRDGGRYPSKSNYRDDRGRRHQFQSNRRNHPQEDFQRSSYEEEFEPHPPNSRNKPTNDHPNDMHKPPNIKPESISQGRVKAPNKDDKTKNSNVSTSKEDLIKSDNHVDQKDVKSDKNESRVQNEVVDSHTENQQTVSTPNKRDLNPEQETQNRSKRPANFIQTDCLILRGLPFSVTDRDILDFFSDEGLAPTQIHIMLDKQGQPAGDAFCEFNTTEEVERALSKNGTHMGRSVVSVNPVSREELMEAIGIPPPPHDHMQEDYPPNFPQQEFRPHFRHPRGMPGYPPRFPRGRGRGFPPSRGRGRGHFPYPEGPGRHHPPPNEMDVDSQSVNAFGKPGCVVAMENVPYRAEVQDIIDFFHGFFVPRDNVIRRFNEDGRPTGDARVCFSSPNEALKAVKNLNFNQIFNREITLTLVQ